MVEDIRPDRRAGYNSLALQSSYYADKEAQISSIARNSLTQDEFLNVYVINVGIFRHNPLMDETFATWYTQHREIYKNIMADSPHATSNFMLLHMFSRSNHYLFSSYFQSMDPADLTYEKIITKLGSVVGDNNSFLNLTISKDENVHYHVDIVNRLCTSFRFGSLEENQFRCLIFILGLRSPCHAEIRLRLLG
ncbi:unnamed protein product [Hymenolepis diminuta]|uniref:Uncharacterized protein n=1 Tax=Hymenolepis diminuta TaxID=6216 RepID=A0A0R3SI02_HYMDI|nr:unnamed protein product [Hymenolepis diminuta]